MKIDQNKRKRQFTELAIRMDLETKGIMGSDYFFEELISAYISGVADVVRKMRKGGQKNG